MKARPEVEEILGMIYSEASAAGCSAKVISSDTGILDRIDTVTFPGRYVTRVVRVRPFEVTKRFVRPQLTSGCKSEPNADSVLNKIFGILNLQNLLLVITPTEEISDKYIVHGYAIDGERHLGVTSLTNDEKDLIVYTQRPDSYNIIYCSTYLQLEDAFKKTEIRNRIFDVLQHRPAKPIRTYYNGKEVELYYRRFKPRKEQPISKKKAIKAARRQEPPESELHTAKTYQARPRSSSVAQSNIRSRGLTSRSPSIDTADNGNLDKLKPTVDGKFNYNRTSKTLMKAHTALELNKSNTIARPNPHMEMSLHSPSFVNRHKGLFKSGRARTQLQVSVDSRNVKPIARAPSENNIMLKASANSGGKSRAQPGYHTNSTASVDKNDMPKDATIDLRPRMMTDIRSYSMKGKYGLRPKSPVRSRTASPKSYVNAEQRLLCKNTVSGRPGIVKSNSLANLTKHRSQAARSSYSNSFVAMGNGEDIEYSKKKIAIESRCHSLGTSDKCRCDHRNLFKNRTYSNLFATHRLNSAESPRKVCPKYRESSDLKITTLMKARSNMPITQDSSNTICRVLLKNGSNLTVESPPQSSIVMSDSQTSLSSSLVPTCVDSNLSIRSSNIEFETPNASICNETLDNINYMTHEAQSPAGDTWSNSIPALKDVESSVSIADSFLSSYGSWHNEYMGIDMDLELDEIDSMKDLEATPRTRNHDKETRNNTRKQVELGCLDAPPPSAVGRANLRMGGRSMQELGNNGCEPNVLPKRKMYMHEIEKAKLSQRERQWVGLPSPNSKRRVVFDDVPKPTRARVLQKKPSVEFKDGIKVLWKVHPLRESDGDIPLSDDGSSVKFETSQSIVNAKSSEFERIMEPVRVPPNFSKRAHEHLKKKLRRMTAKQAFENLGKLVDKINSRPIPQNRQLLRFFRIAELLEIKMFARAETYWNGKSPTIDPRCRLECYMFDDRNEFILSLGLLCKQLTIFSELFPRVKPNICYIDNALQLTIMPKPVTEFLRTVMVTLRAQTLFKLMAEMVYELLQPRATLLALARAHQSNTVPQAERNTPDFELKNVLEMEEALRKLKNQEPVTLD